MGKEEIQAIVDIALQPKQKTENRKVILILIFGCTISTILGIDLGGWHSWREDMTVWRVKIDTKLDAMQREDNHSNIQRINQIKVK